MDAIECCICHKAGTHADVHRDGFRLAANWPFAYTCSPACDDKAKEITDAKRKERK